MKLGVWHYLTYEMYGDLFTASNKNSNNKQKGDDVMELVSIKEASEISALSRQYIWQLCRQSRIAYQRIGKMFVIEKSDLQAYLDSREQKQQD